MRALGAIVVAVALSGAACKPPGPAAKNVVVLLVDTLRAQRLSLYGYGRATSPRLDRRARLATVFDTARAQAPCTFPSVNSILTSRYPAEFLGQQEGRPGIPAGIESWPEILKRHGYSTGAVSASFVVRSTPSRHNRQGGFGRGFDHFDETCEDRDARCVNERALALLEDLPSPYFLYLHYMEPHDPYSPPPWHRRRWSTESRSELSIINEGRMWDLKHWVFGHGPPRAWQARDLDHLSDLYDEEIAYFDAEFESLMQELGRRGQLAETLVVLMADHGEHLLFEHHQLQHCQNVYEESIRTPLVFWLPGQTGGARVADPVQNLDVLPTVLDLLGLPFDASRFKGRSLRRLVSGDRIPERIGFAMQGRWLTAFDRQFKLIVNLESGERRLFDLRSDPGEHYDVSAREGAALARLGEAIQRWAKQEGVGDEELLRRSLEGEELLRAVGYL